MKQNDILLMGGVAVLGLAAYTMMSKNNQPQQPIFVPYPQQQQPQQAQQQKQPVSSSPKPSFADELQKWIDIGSGVANIGAGVVSVFKKDNNNLLV